MLVTRLGGPIDKVLTEPEISQNDKHDDYDPNDVEDVAAHDVSPLFDHAPTGTQPTDSL
jgi:hypothetical protein